VLETPHFIVGVSLATKVTNPLLAFPLALGSHFVLDKIPHWNPHLFTEKTKFGKITKRSRLFVVIDVSIAIVAGLLISSLSFPNTKQAITVFIAGLLAISPDIVEGPYYFFNLKSKLIERWVLWKKSIQSDTTLVFGVLTQIAIIIAALWWIFL
jgi:hypothetical protein